MVVMFFFGFCSFRLFIFPFCLFESVSFLPRLPIPPHRSKLLNRLLLPLPFTPRKFLANNSRPADSLLVPHNCIKIYTLVRIWYTFMHLNSIHTYSYTKKKIQNNSRFNSIPVFRPLFSEMERAGEREKQKNLWCTHAFSDYIFDSSECKEIRTLVFCFNLI